MNNPKVIILALAGVCIAANAYASNVMIENGEQNARFQSVDTTFTADPAPTLTMRVVGGVAVLVEGEDIEDLFPSTTNVTEVIVTIQPPSGEVIEVTASSGPSWTENPTSGAWSATFPMPSAGGTTLGEFDIVVDPDDDPLSYASKFKVKKATGGTG